MAGGGGDEHQGSSAWKLALADFMISMMCIFLTLWILQYLDKQDKQQLIDILAPESDSVPELMILPHKNSINPIQLDYIATTNVQSDLKHIEDSSLIDGEFSSEQLMDVLAEEVDEVVDKLDAEGSVTVQITPQGLKITISDDTAGPMFQMGRTRIMPFYQDLLLGLADALSSVNNKIVVAGHTDASRFVGSDRTNWDLSTGRANRARYFLEKGGVGRGGFFQVIGFAETALTDRENPRSSKNRRIEIVVLTKEAEKQLESVYHSTFDGGDIDEQQLDVMKGQGVQEAKANKSTTVFDELSSI
ncbi:OmpA family protein [Vibrio barjaei]|uniref:OmpA family protein n=1 Tax=Vibrio barjaei TaxID=1676683 RepID=UPI002284FC72|nr:OmpA family protein [Vibrio barjaei]MCY9872293.1 OmpA family protein [Vibrio barjaei]